MNVPDEPKGLVRVKVLSAIEHPEEVLILPLTEEIVHEPVVGRVIVDGNLIVILELLGTECCGYSVILYLVEL